MNKKVIFGALALVVLAAVVFTAGCVDESSGPTYVVGIDDYSPYSYTDENGKIVGFDVECMQWIANEEGYNVEFEYIDWDALLTYLEQGKRDIICSGLSITDERAERMAFSDPYWVIGIDVVAKEGSDFTMDQFYNGDLTIGVQLGCTSDLGLEDYLGSDLYAKMMKEGKIKNTFGTFALSMQALHDGRVDVVIFDSAGIKEQVAANPGEYKVIGTIAGSEELFAAAVKIGNDELLNKINDGYAKLMSSPDWTALVEKYGIDDLEE